jgi:glycosyltransferase involved in cell wall biosynthesis
MLAECHFSGFDCTFYADSADKTTRDASKQCWLSSAEIMTVACLINNYNYADFIGDAVDSALRQTVPFDEIIVVDDGSTDGSLELLERRYGQNPRVQILAKQNQGQLSCFNEGFARSTGDIVFFLDADDVYEPNHVEQSLAVYCRDPGIDFVFCGHRLFGQRDGVQLRFPEDRDLGYSVILTAYLREWIGAPTSCLSMRRSILERILPLPFLQAWRTRADDCLVFGASLAGARKYYLAEPSVRYRVHPGNHFLGHKADKCATYRRRLAINALLEHLEAKFSYNVVRFGDFHHREFYTIAKPNFRQLKQYYSITARAPAPVGRRLKSIAAMTVHFLRAALRPAPASAEISTARTSAHPDTPPPSLSRPSKPQSRAA